MMRKWILGVSAVALVATACMARPGERLSKECRRQVVELCGGERGKMRDCLRVKGKQLSDACQGEFGTLLMERMGRAEKNAAPKMEKAALALGAVEHSYGSEPLQRLDFYAAKGSGKAGKPLIIFVHGGGWKRGDKRNATGTDKVEHYTGLGYHLASVNYRLVPAATVEEQAADVAAAIAYLVRHAEKFGIDTGRIVLMGHSAGAHLSALVGTDPQYLRGAGLSLDALSGVVPLDGAAYEVAAQMADGNRIMQDTYKQAFGSDPARQKALSPTLQAVSPNAPAFLILHVDRADGKRQSEALAAALRSTGTKVQLNAFKGQGMKGHAEINRRLGDPAYPATPVVDAWLKTVFS